MKNSSLHLLYNALENNNLTFDDIICAEVKVNYRYIMKSGGELIDTVEEYKLELNYSKNDLVSFKDKLNLIDSYDGGGDFRIFGNVWFTYNRCLEKTSPDFYAIWELKSDITIPDYLK